MNTNTNTENHLSCGGVVFKNEDNEIQIVICGRQQEGEWLWGLPKGTPNPHETNKQTAIREVTEETGLQVSAKTLIGSINYSFVRVSDQVLCNKIVYFYLMEAIGGSFDDHDHEFDEVKWVGETECLQLLTHQNEINMVNQAINIIRKQ
jgi:8-oxo-dGTP pyrophosphatase MutT (NUDIX family)